MNAPAAAGAHSPERSYLEYACSVMDKVYDVRALVEAARSRLDMFEHCDTDELVDVDRVLRIASAELHGIALRLDEKSYTYTLKGAPPNAPASGGA
ncbi:MAG: hypothetical protein JNL19_05565 [Burkholderiales bacterium]|nr:hypothetical protein [Burkholderiales bacterium]